MMQTDINRDSWVVMPPPSSDWTSNRVPPAHAPLTPLQHQQNRKKTQDYLPKDPRMWTREHVALWLNHMASRHQLDNTCIVDRFPMNGKALCLMNVDMFLQRVPLGGKLLYKDFQLRLGRAMYLGAN